MIRSRFRCYEIESCYTARVLYGTLERRRRWWRILWNGLLDWIADRNFRRCRP